MNDTTLNNSVRPVAWPAAVVASLIFALVLLAMIGIDARNERSEYDQNNYHLLVIQDFSKTWPVADVRDYLSATTPGYHWLLAAFGSDANTLRMLGSLFGLALLGLVGYSLARRMPGDVQLGLPPWVGGVFLSLPLAMSMYVVASARWLLPDDAAWVCVWLLLVMMWRDRPWVLREIVLAGLVLVVLVLFRQIHLWLAGGLWASAWLWGMSSMSTGRVKPVFAMLVATLPAVLVVGIFFAVWGGASPPAMQTHVQGPNPAVAAVVLSLLGLFSLFFVGWLWRGLRGMVAEQDGWCWLRRCLFGGLVVGLLVGALPHTSWQVTGRMGGLWHVARLTPVVMDRSVVIIGLSMFGGLAAGAWFAVMAKSRGEQGHRESRLWLVVLGLFVLANTASAHAWQRYYEPFLLMLLALTVVSLMRSERSHDEKLPRWVWAGPVVLAVLQAANLYRAMT